MWSFLIIKYQLDIIFLVKNGNPVLAFSLTLYPSGLSQAVLLESLEEK